MVIMVDGLSFDRFFQMFHEFDYPSMREAIADGKVLGVLMDGQSQQLVDSKIIRVGMAQIHLNDQLDEEEVKSLASVLVSDYHPGDESDLPEA